MYDIDGVNLGAVDLNLLVALDALLAEAHVGAAARRVGLSQPAMSHALRRLRELLDDPLLVRSGNTMAPTARAEALREPLRDVLREVAGLLRPPTFDAARSSRRFRLVASDYAAAVVVPALLARLAVEAPGVTVDVEPFGRDDARSRDRLEQADAALTCAPERYGWMVQRRLFTDHDVLVVRAGHPADDDADTVLGLDHIAVVELDGVPDPVDDWLDGIGRPRRVVSRVPQYVQALQLVAASDRAAVVPARLVAARGRGLGLEARPFPIDPGTFEERLLFAPRHRHDPGGAWFRDAVTRAAPR